MSTYAQIRNVLGKVATVLSQTQETLKDTDNEREYRNIEIYATRELEGCSTEWDTMSREVINATNN